MEQPKVNKADLADVVASAVALYLERQGVAVQYTEVEADAPLVEQLMDDRDGCPLCGDAGCVCPGCDAGICLCDDDCMCTECLSAD